MVELVLTVAVAIGVALLVQAVLVKPYKIPSGSMIPTLQIHQRILVNRLATHPGLGDIVVFHPPAGALEGDRTASAATTIRASAIRRHATGDYGGESSETYVKRVVGLPGDHLRIIDGKVLRDGVRSTAATSSPATPARASATFPSRSPCPRAITS